MTPASFLFAIILIIIARGANNFESFSRKVFLFSLFTALVTNSGYIFVLSGFPIPYDFFLALLSLVFFFLSGRFLEIKIFHVILLVILLLSVGLSWFFVTLSNTPVLATMETSGAQLWNIKSIETQVRLEQEQVKRLILFLFSMLFFLQISVYGRIKGFWSSVEKLLIIAFKINVLIGLFDFLTKAYLRIPLIQVFTTAFLGETNSYLFSGFRGSRVAITGFMREPTHFATFLIPGISLLIAKDKRTGTENVFVLLSILVLFLSTSFLGIGVIFYAIFLFCVKRAKEVAFIVGILTLVTVIVLIVAVSQVALGENSLIGYYTTRFNAFKSFDQNSTEIRSVRNSYAFQKWLERPLFGFGLGTISVNGFVPTILASLGIIGTVAWFSFVLSATMQYSFFICIDFIAWLLLMTFAGGGFTVYTFQGFVLILGTIIVMRKKVIAGEARERYGKSKPDADL